MVERRIHLRFNDPVEFEVGVLVMSEMAARSTIEQRFGTFVGRMGKGTMILNRGDYLSLLRSDPLLLELL